MLPADQYLPPHTDALLEDELTRINKLMYERNVELAVRNRTLSILRKIYEIINTSLGITETAQKLVDAIVDELKFQVGFIALIDKTEHTLSTVAITTTTTSDEQAFFRSFKVSLKQDDNLCVKSVFYRTWRMTNILDDVFTPYCDAKDSQKIQESLLIKTSIIYPIIFGGEVLGTLMFGMDKHVGDLSRTERETLHEIIEVVGIAIERAQIYADLKDANEKLTQLDHLKDEFVSLASHELRTPMTAIKSYLWMALSGRGGELSEKQKFYLDRAYGSTTRLIKLVNDMLNVSRIESGRITIELKEVNMSQLITEVIEEVKPRSDEMGVALKLTPGSVSNVVADSDKIKEVVINLIGNSIKFTPRGGLITIFLEQKDGFILTHVADTGVGLTAENISKLFQKFALIKDSYQTNKPDNQGTGLGLYICKSIIELHGGKIWAASEGTNHGTTMTFSLRVFNPSEVHENASQDAGKEKLGIIHTAVI